MTNNGIPEFLITMQSVENPDIQDLVLADCHNVANAVKFGFYTRNIASSWVIANIESDDIEVDDLNFPVTFAAHFNIC